MSEPNYHEIEATVAELDEQIDALQSSKRDFWKGIRDEHGKKLTDQIKLAVKLNRMDGEKRIERDEIEEGAFRILAILQKPRAPRATRAHTREAGEITPNSGGESRERQKSGIVPVSKPEAPPMDEAQSLVTADQHAAANAEGPSETAAQISNPQASSSRQADSPALTSSPESGTNSDDFTPPAFLNKPKAAADYRPHRQHPEACGASGLDHCYSCKKALSLDSEAA